MSQRNWFEDRERKKNILRTNSQWLKWIGQYFKAEMFICFIHIKSFRIYTKKHMLQFNENLNGYLSHWSTGLKSKFMCQFWKRPPSTLPIVAHSRHGLAFMHQYIVCGASATQGLPLSPILCMRSILFNYSTKLCLRIIARVPFLSNTNFSFGWFIFLMSVCLFGLRCFCFCCSTPQMIRMRCLPCTLSSWKSLQPFKRTLASVQRIACKQFCALIWYNIGSGEFYFYQQTKSCWREN